MMGLSPEGMRFMEMAQGSWRVLLTTKLSVTRVVAIDVWFDACEEVLKDFRMHLAEAERKNAQS